MTDFAIIGFGSRGTLFAGYIKENANMRLTAVVDVCEEQLVLAQKEYGVSADRCYRDYRDFYRAGKIADAVIVASQDADHYAHTIPALEAGYDVLLEKPVANRLEDCIGIRDKANALHRKVMVCHVLRYSHFYDFVKKIIDGGEIGRVININQTENVGYWHYAHSFIRGAWRNSDTSSPMILAKCCHDLDIITYLIGSDCESISSFGHLTYFKEENAPNGSAAYCFKCPLKDKCVFNCLKIYNDRNWMVLGSRSQLSADCMEELEEKLKDENNPFSRCVFRCDNNVVDHQEVEMLYKNGATAHLTMTPFSEECTRTLNVHGTAGEIEGDMEKKMISVTVFGKGRREIDLAKLGLYFHCHGGGDKKLLNDFAEYISGKENIRALTTIDKSIESHLMCFAAEKSRLANGKPFEVLRGEKI